MPNPLKIYSTLLITYCALLGMFSVLPSQSFAIGVDGRVNQRLCATCQDVYQKVRQAEQTLKETETDLEEAKKELIDHYKAHGNQDQLADEYDRTKDDIATAKEQYDNELKYFKRPKSFMDGIKKFFGVKVRQGEKNKIVELQGKIRKLEDNVKDLHVIYAKQQELKMRITELREQIKSAKVTVRQAKRHVTLCKKYNCFMVEEDNYHEIHRKAVSQKENFKDVIRSDPGEGKQCLLQLSRPIGVKLNGRQECKKLDDPYWLDCCRSFKKYYKAVQEHKKLQRQLAPYHHYDNRKRDCRKACDYYFEYWGIKDYANRATQESLSYDFNRELILTDQKLQNLSAKMAELQAQLEQRDVSDADRESLEKRQDKIREAMSPLIEEKSKITSNIANIKQSSPNLCNYQTMAHKLQICYSYCEVDHIEVNLDQQVENLLRCDTNAY